MEKLNTRILSKYSKMGNLSSWEALLSESSKGRLVGIWMREQMDGKLNRWDER